MAPQPSIKNDENRRKFQVVENAVNSYAWDETIPAAERTYNLECLSDFIRDDLLNDVNEVEEHEDEDASS